jgi:hypothetical protein
VPPQKRKKHCIEKKKKKGMHRGVGGVAQVLAHWQVQGSEFKSQYKQKLKQTIKTGIYGLSPKIWRTYGSEAE